MSLEQKINYQLNKYPAVKRVVKRAYQTGMYALSKKIKSEAGYFDENLLRHQDLQLLLDFLYHHNMEVIEDYLCILF